MSLSSFQLNLIGVFFIYGLAFFSMGIALVLETSRAPRLAERRVLRPLALFGLLHGVHEWIEIYLLQGEWSGLAFPSLVSWFRVIWLVLSFLPLVLFGALLLASIDRQKRTVLVLPVGLLALYAISLSLSAGVGDEIWIARRQTRLPVTSLLSRLVYWQPGRCWPAPVRFSVKDAASSPFSFAGPRSVLECMGSARCSSVR
jgi:hypothetical protein